MVIKNSRSSVKRKAKAEESKVSFHYSEVDTDSEESEEVTESVVEGVKALPPHHRDSTKKQKQKNKAPASQLNILQANIATVVK